MKRDMDLVRQILLYVEEHQKPSSPEMLGLVGAAEDGQAKLGYHVRMLVEEAGYLRGNRRMNANAAGGGQEYLYMELTWGGHEFLSTLRDPTIWERTKKVAAAAGGGGLQVFLDIGTALVTEAAKEQLKKIGIGL